MVIKNDVFIRKPNGEYVELPWYVLEPQAYGSPLQGVTIRRRAVKFLVGVGPEAGVEIKVKAPIVPLTIPMGTAVLKPKKVRAVPEHSGKFTIGPVWTQNVINGEISYNTNTDRKLRFHANKVGLDYTDLTFIELLKQLGERLAADQSSEPGVPALCPSA